MGDDSNHDGLLKFLEDTMLISDTRDVMQLLLDIPKAMVGHIKTSAQAENLNIGLLFYYSKHAHQAMTKNV